MYNFLKCAAVGLATSLSASAVVYQIGNNYSANGDGTVLNVNNNDGTVTGGSYNNDATFSGPGGDSGVSTALTYNSNGSNGNGTGTPLVADPSNYNALYIGNNDGFDPGAGGFPNYRTVVTFDLSSLALPTLGAGEVYKVNSIDLIFEISGGTNASTQVSGSVDRPTTTIDFYAANAPNYTDNLNALVGTKIFNETDFFPSTGNLTVGTVSLDTSAIDPNGGPLGTFAVTLNAPGIDEAGGNFKGNGWFTLGSGRSADGSPASPADIEKSPHLDIDIEVVPEPSAALLGVLGGWGLIARRRR